MQMLRPVTVDLATGIVTLGGTRVALQRDGEHYVALGGLRARTLTFEERSWVVAGALIDPEPNRALLTELRNLANVRDHRGDELADALALALAGGGEPAPSFAECARSACRHANVDWQTVQQTPAVLVDQLAAEQETSGGDDGWTRFEFREALQAEVTLAECCRQMLESLLERGTPQETQDEHGATGARPWPSQTKLRVSRDEAQTAGPDSGRAEPSSRPKFAWPRAERAIRAQATLTPTERPPLAAAPQISNPPSPVDTALQAISGGPQASQADAGVSQTASSGENSSAVSVAGASTSQWPGTASAGIAKNPTMWDAKEWRASQRSPEQTLDSIAGRAIAPIATKTRLRAHRLRDLPVRSQKAIQPLREAPNPQRLSAEAQDPTLSDNTMAELLPRSSAPQRDWLYEIATALADECDLRGLDA